MTKLHLFIVFITCLCKSSAKVNVSDFFPFGTNTSDVSYVSLYGSSDDGFSREIDLTIPFPFFDNLHNSLWVNVNGAISFLRGISTYTPICKPVPQDFRMVAPFWADIDLNRGGDIFYRQTFDEFILDRAQVQIIEAFPEMKHFKVKWVFIATWHNVTFYGSNGCADRKLNTFQSILATNGIQSFAIFLYNEITWTLGTASGGRCDGNSDSNTAKVGFDAGDGKSLDTVPGSCGRDIISINEKSNYGHPGQWVFRIDNAVIQSAGCEQNFNGSIRLIPTFIDMFGHVPVLVSGPCFDESTKVRCIFKDPIKGKVDALGYRKNNESDVKILCNAPIIYKTGRINLDVVLSSENGTEQIYSGHLSVIPPNHENSDLRVTFAPTDNEKLNLTFNWNKDHFINSNLVLKIYTYHNDVYEWKEYSILETNIENSGYLLKILTRDKFPFELFDTIWSFSLQEIKSDDKELRIDKREMKDIIQPLGLWTMSRFLDIYRFLWPLVGKDCQTWYETDKGPPDDLPPCPPTTEWAKSDPRFTIDPGCAKPPCEFHPGADFCTRSIIASPSGSGQQCCYKSGKLLIGPPGGGTVDKCHFSNRWCHWTEDVLPWARCCKNNDLESCNKYYKMRPSDNGTNYEPPVMAAARGDPHITTFDNFDYTFNGAGHFYMIKNQSDMPALVEARMEPLALTGTDKKATIFTAFYMKCGNSSSVQIQRSNIRKADIFIDGILMDLNDPLLFNMMYHGVHISIGENISSASISFECGFNFQIQINDALAIIASCAKKWKGHTSGLLGVYDGNPDNDFQDPDGRIIGPSSSLKDIHYEFGVKWRVAETDSLFRHSNKNDTDYNLLEFIPSFEEPDFESAPQEAKDVCGMSKDCLYDYQISGSPTFAKQTKMISETLNETVQLFKREIVTCPPLTHPDNGYYQTDNFFPGSGATYFCNTNYTLEGNAFVLCSEKGLWNGTGPICLQNQLSVNSNNSVQNLTSQGYILTMTLIFIKYYFNFIFT